MTMDIISSTSVITRDGQTGTVLRSVRAADQTERVLVALDDLHVLLPADLLIAQSDGTYQIPLDRAALRQYVADERVQGDLTEQIVVPVLEEFVQVGKRQVERGVVSIHKTVQERQEIIDQPLLREDVTVERVAVNRVLDAPVDVRYEGDTMIVPIVEEVLVVEKRLMLREEVRITKHQQTVHEPQQVTLRREEVVVEHSALDEREVRGAA